MLYLTGDSHKNAKHQIYPTKTGVYVHSLILRAKTEVSDRKNFVFSFFVIIAWYSCNVYSFIWIREKLDARVVQYTDTIVVHTICTDEYNL